MRPLPDGQGSVRTCRGLRRCANADMAKAANIVAHGFALNDENNCR
jgi:hypothetical protein